MSDSREFTMTSTASALAHWHRLCPVSLSLTLVTSGHRRPR